MIPRGEGRGESSYVIFARVITFFAIHYRDRGLWAGGEGEDPEEGRSREFRTRSSEPLPKAADNIGGGLSRIKKKNELLSLSLSLFLSLPSPARAPPPPPPPPARPTDRRNKID